MQIQKWENCFRTVIQSLFEFGCGLIHFRNRTHLHFGIGLAEVNIILKFKILSVTFRNWTHSLQIRNEIVDKFIDHYLYFRNGTHVKKVFYTELDSFLFRNWTYATFGIRLISKMMQTPFYKAIQCLSKRDLKVNKSFFYLKRILGINNLL